MQIAASSLTASSGGSHSGKKGLVAYIAKVRATMAWLQGRTIIHSTHNLGIAIEGTENGAQEISETEMVFRLAVVLHVYQIFVRWRLDLRRE